ncbi:MAG: hypothetical protein V4722_25970 [Bacteroidota bacterium]
MKNNFVFNLLQVIFTLVGVGMLVAGYFAAPGSLTDDGFALNKFFYAMGGFFIVWPIILFGTIKYFYRRAAQKVADLKANGIKGKARVLQMRRTNLTVNRIPQVILDLDIKTSLGEQFPASYKKCIDPIYYSLIRPDLDLTVYVDPNNHKSLYVDFEEAWARMGSSRGNTGFPQA